MKCKNKNLSYFLIAGCNNKGNNKTEADECIQDCNVEEKEKKEIQFIKLQPLNFSRELRLID